MRPSPRRGMARSRCSSAGGHPRWGWRTELDDQVDGALRIRMFNIEPDREETIGVAIDLTREAAAVLLRADARSH